MSDHTVEPWMRGPLAGVEPMVQPLFFSFTQVREDLALHTRGILQEQLWRRAGALPSLGFHLRHIGGSVDRLTAYLMEQPLTPEQLTFLKDESTPGATLDELLSAIEATLSATEARLRTIDPATIHDPRYIGRKRLPTTVLGLLVHLAEHTQRHLGQAITTAKLARGAT
jgi:hypothetical protein